MLKIDSLILLDENGKEKPVLQDCFDDGVINFPYDKKDEFMALALSFSEIKSGSLSVGDCVLAGDNSNKISIFELDVSINGIASLTAVFFSTKNQRDLFAFERSVSKDLKETRALPVSTLEEKKAKMAHVIDILRKNEVSYLLFDENDALTFENSSWIKETLASTSGLSVFLGKAVQEAATAKPSVPFAAGVLTEGKKTAILRTLLFGMSFLSGLAFLFGGVFLKNGRISHGIVSLLLGLVFAFLVFLLGALAFKSRSLKKKTSSFLSFEAINACLVALGVGLSYLLCFLLAYKQWYFTKDSLTGLPQVLIIFFGFLMLFLPFFGRVAAGKGWFKKLLAFLKIK